MLDGTQGETPPQLALGRILLTEELESVLQNENVDIQRSFLPSPGNLFLAPAYCHDSEDCRTQGLVEETRSENAGMV